MSEKRLERLLAPLGLAIVWLALIFGALSLLANPSHADASLQEVAPLPADAERVVPLSVERQAGIADVAVQASEVPPISNIIGATYDDARGEVIVFGVADPDLPSLDFSYIRENLVVGLRAFYDSSGPEIPGVTIEGTEDPLEVIYFGGVTNTHFGQVTFESDRLLKIYTMGVDNLTGITVTSEVTGYMSFPDRMQLQTETVEDPVVIRYFFTPTLLIEPIATPHTIIFSQTQGFIDWAYMSAATSAATTEAAQGFVDNFNQYYLDYAAERWAVHGDTTLYEMAQLSKLTAIGKWARDQGLELKLPGMNDPWLSRYPVAYAATVTQTPAITVTWVQTISGVPYELGLQGGVYAIGDIHWIPPTADGQLLADDVQDAVETPRPLEMIYHVRPNHVHPLGDPFETQGPLAAYVVPLADNAVVNGDFEDGPGSAPWGQDSYFEMIGSFSPHNGAYAAQFPVYHNARVALSQTLYVPTDATMARLTYWRAAATSETTHPHDFFASFLNGAGGTRLTTFETLDDGDADAFWHEVSFDVTSYTGQVLQLWFTATTDAANITNFFVDDASLDYLDLTPPTVEAVTAPDEVIQTGAVDFTLAFHERMNTAVAPIVTISPQGSQETYTLTARTGAGYTHGYLDSDPTRWSGTYVFTLQMQDGTYALDVSAAQDLAENVMYPAEDIHTFTFDPTAPQVQSVFPADGASGVPVDASIVISFSKSINTSTFAYTVSPDPGGWQKVWDGAKQVVTLTHNDLAPGTTHTVTILEASDLAGHSLASAPLSWSFTTADSHKVYLPLVLMSVGP
jgi:hypothetical protein